MRVRVRARVEVRVEGAQPPHLCAGDVLRVVGFACLDEPVGVARLVDVVAVDVLDDEVVVLLGLAPVPVPVLRYVRHHLVNLAVVVDVRRPERVGASLAGLLAAELRPVDVARADRVARPRGLPEEEVAPVPLHVAPVHYVARLRLPVLLRQRPQQFARLRTMLRQRLERG